MQTAVKCSILFSELKNQHKAYPQSLVFGFKISRQLGLSNLVSRNVFSTQSFSAKFGSDFNFKQNFSVTFSLIFLRKNRSEAFCVSSEKYIAVNVSRLALSGVEPTPSHYKYNKTFHSAADFP